jgi:peptidoglycan/LPS O-acetylase OafA/YrhL
MNPSPAAPGIGRYRDDIQGVRALAVLMVVAYHAGLPAPGG